MWGLGHRGQGSRAGTLEGRGEGGQAECSRVDGTEAWDFDREELGKNINADEAAAMGAVYQAAALSKAFKVKPFVVRDAVVYPILVSKAV